jgi:glycosyltransferase involved in cell wall biosynthesis
MDLERGVSCIIPFYNEEKYILEVLEAVTAVRGISEIICVDDGSTDGSGRLVAGRFPQVRLFTLSGNEGKAAAVRLAAGEARFEITLLVDADLRHLDPTEVSEAIGAMRSETDTGMVILSRNNAPWYLKMLRINTLLSGERLLRTEDLITVLSGQIKGYQIETAINLYMWKEGIRTSYLNSGARNTYKFEKCRPWQFIVREVKMYSSILRHAGIFSFLCLVMFFAKEKTGARTVPRLVSFSNLFR